MKIKCIELRLVQAVDFIIYIHALIAINYTYIVEFVIDQIPCARFDFC